MMPAEPFDEELDYLHEYAKKGLLYFVPVWDSAETLAGSGAPVSRVREIALELIGALVDRGVRVGELSTREDRDIEPWNLDKKAILSRIEEGMKQRPDPLDFVDICGFRA